MRRVLLEALVIVWCVAGCASDRGLAIEVDVGQTGATSVELFISKEDCTDETRPPGVKCTGIRPRDVPIELPGEIWFRDDSEPYTAEVKGTTATFQLKADASTTLRIVIAVGYKDGDPTHTTGTAVLHDLLVPAGSARIATTTLTETSPVTAKPSSLPTEDRATVWSETTLPSVCVAVEHWQGGKPKRYFVVPADDPDCDDVPRSAECNANDYLGSLPGGVAAKPDCFAPGVGACVLGSRACTDADGPTPGTCTAQLSQSQNQGQSQVCVPSQFCRCDAIDGRCTGDTIDPTTTGAVVPHFDCHVPTRPDGGLCPGESSAALSLDMLSGCEQALIGSLQLTSFDTSASFGGALMELSSGKGSCGATLTWKSGARTSIDVPDHGMVKVKIGDRTLLIPIVFRFAPGCGSPEPFKCTIPPLSLTDSLWSCAHP